MSASLLSPLRCQPALQRQGSLFSNHWGDHVLYDPDWTYQIGGVGLKAFNRPIIPHVTVSFQKEKVPI